MVFPHCRSSHWSSASLSSICWLRCCWNDSLRSSSCTAGRRYSVALTYFFGGLPLSRDSVMAVSRDGGLTGNAMVGRLAMLQSFQPRVEPAPEGAEFSRCGPMRFVLRHALARGIRILPGDALADSYRGDLPYFRQRRRGLVGPRPPRRNLGQHERVMALEPLGDCGRRRHRPNVGHGRAARDQGQVGGADGGGFAWFVAAGSVDKDEVEGVRG